MRYTINETDFENFVSNNKIVTGIIHTDTFMKGLADFDIYIPHKVVTIDLWEINKCKLELETAQSFKISVILEDWFETEIEFEFFDFEVLETNSRELLITFQDYKIRKNRLQEEIVKSG